MPDQIQLITKSLKDFKNNLILLVPILLTFGLGAVFVGFLMLQFFFGALIFRADILYQNTSAGLIAYIAFFALLDIFLYVLGISYVRAAYYGMVADVVINGKSSFRRLLQHGKKLLKPVLTYFTAEVVIFTVPLALIFLIGLAGYLFSSAAGYAVAIALSLLYILALIAFGVITLFNAPILAGKGIGGFRVIIESFRYGKSHFEHVIITLAVLIVLWIITSVIQTIIYIPGFVASVASELTPSAGAQVTLSLTSFFFNILSSIASAICGVIMLLYIFNSYFDKNPVKNWK